MLQVREEDQPLRQDVHRLATLLGSVVADLEGAEAFEAVESLRTASRARRYQEPGAPSLDELLARVEALPVERAAVVGRAFTLFFLLINTAEQVHRVRRRRSYQSEPAQPASPRWALRRLKAAGVPAAEVAEAVGALEIRPVLTAHPTESTRRSVLKLLSRVAELLHARDGARTEADRGDIDARMRAEVELLWLTEQTRQERLSVADEVSTGLWYLEERLVDAAVGLSLSLDRAFCEVYGSRLTDHLPALPVPVTFGTWVGGDRDGNPFVTPDVTRQAAAAAAARVLEVYDQALEDAVDRASLSGGAEPALLASLEADRERLPGLFDRHALRDAQEPVRLKLKAIRARLDARRSGASSGGSSGGSSGVAYATADDFVADLELVAQVAGRAGATGLVRFVLEPLIVRVRAHGFHGLRMDVREDAGAHTAALGSIAEAIGIPALDEAALSRELLGRRPLVGPDTPLPDDARRTLGVFGAIRDVQADLGEAAVSTYVISMAESTADVLRVLLLGREAGLCDLAADVPRSSIDVVPLFETRRDLINAPGVLRRMLADPAYQRQLAARGQAQEVMLGYSDSAKDAGVLPAAWRAARLRR